MSTNEEIHEPASAEWDAEVAAKIGPGMAKYEMMRGKILCPEERLVFLAGYICHQEQILAQLSALRVKLDDS